MPEQQGRSNQGVAAIIEAFDGLVEAAEGHLQSLDSEKPSALDSGDPRYIRRIERGLSWTQQIIDLLDEDVLELIMSLRQNARQLELAREGKMV